MGSHLFDDFDHFDHIETIIFNNDHDHDHDHHSGKLLVGFDHILEYKVTC